MNPDENYLIHYGVLGMKWGIRRANRFDSTAYDNEEASRRYKKLAGQYKDVAGTYKNIANGERVLSGNKLTKEDKKRIKTDAKSLRKYGLPNSNTDRNNGRSGTAFYNKLSIQNGKDYADAVMAKNMRYTETKLLAAKAVGAAYVAGVALATIGIPMSMAKM